jgi:hypothetical protein
VSAVTGIAAGLLRGDVPLHPDREQARAWAEQELLRREYQAERPSLISRLWNWLTDRLQQLPHPGDLPANLGLAIAAGILIALVCYVLWRSGGVRRSARVRAADGLFEGIGRTAAEHRAAADIAQAAGDLRTAVLERFRGLIRGLQERALLDLEPGRTADEAAVHAGSWLPDLAAELTLAADWFDDVRYGDRPATLQVADGLRDLDRRVQRTRPVAAPVPSGPVDQPR